VGSFYAVGRPKREWLAYFAREFTTCEINSTFYALPAPSGLKSMVEKTGEGFVFSIKANQKMTHQFEDNASVFEAFCRVLEPVAGKLGCILAQFPYSFKLNRQRRDYLELFKKDWASYH